MSKVNETIESLLTLLKSQESRLDKLEGLLGVDKKEEEEIEIDPLHLKAARDFLKGRTEKIEILEEISVMLHMYWDGHSKAEVDAKFSVSDAAPAIIKEAIEDLRIDNYNWRDVGEVREAVSDFQSDLDEFWDGLPEDDDYREELFYESTKSRP